MWEMIIGGAIFITMIMVYLGAYVIAKYGDSTCALIIFFIILSPFILAVIAFVIYGNIIYIQDDGDCSKRKVYSGYYTFDNIYFCPIDCFFLFFNLVTLRTLYLK